MKTIEQWWEGVTQDESLFNDWLLKQYHGELTASIRIRNMARKYNLSPLQRTVIHRIASDEARHAKWVKDILISRGVNPKNNYGTNRYWDKTLDVEKLDSGSYSFEELCAIACHAESMRLDRIVVLMKQTGHVDIAEVFSRIYLDELFHANAFRDMSTPELLTKYKENHELGKKALGLVA